MVSEPGYYVPFCCELPGARFMPLIGIIMYAVSNILGDVIYVVFFILWWHIDILRENRCDVLALRP